MPTQTAKHICNSHEPTLNPKIAKELGCLPPLTWQTLKKTKSFKDRKRND